MKYRVDILGNKAYICQTENVNIMMFVRNKCIAPSQRGHKHRVVLLGIKASIHHI